MGLIGRMGRRSGEAESASYLPFVLFVSGGFAAYLPLILGATAEGAFVGESTAGMSWSELALRMP